MRNIYELQKALREGKKLMWNDPDPIEGSDYTITHVEELDDEWEEHTPILIQYGLGSEAEVFLHEILIG